MPTTTTDLTTASDIELDAALMIGYRQHKKATNAQARAECHQAIAAILSEQSLRLEGWLHAQAPATTASAPATA